MGAVRDRDEQILGLANVVKVVAVHILRRLPRSYCLEDLIQVGWIGAIRAVDRYQGNLGASLSTYARHVIWGTMMDYLREDDFLSRTERHKMRGEVVPLPISLADLDISYISHCHSEDRLLSSLLATVDMGHLIKKSGLSHRDRGVLYRYGEEPTRDIANDLGVTPGRVWQIYQGATQSLRRAKARGAVGGVRP